MILVIYSLSGILNSSYFVCTGVDISNSKSVHLVSQNLVKVVYTSGEIFVAGNK